MTRNRWIALLVSGSILLGIVCVCLAASLIFIFADSQKDTANPGPGIEATAPPAQPSVKDGGARAVVRDEWVETLKNIQATTLPIHDPFVTALRFRQIPEETSRELSLTDPHHQIGDTYTFEMSNFDNDKQYKLEATLRAQTEHASWWVANDVLVDQQDLEASARVFEERTYPKNRAIFGEEWSPGIDGDPQINILLAEISGAGGYFSGSDLFPRALFDDSNEMELININVEDDRPGESYFDGVVAHEFQHLIHWQTDRNEELWLNEGLGELAAGINGFDVGDAVSSFLRDPDIPLTNWLDDGYPYYGSAYLFVNYFYERFGQEAVAELARHPADGARAFDLVLADEEITFDDLFADWVVANLVNDDSLEDGRFEHTVELSKSAAIDETIREFPTVDGSEVYQYGTDYLRVDAGDEEGTLLVEVRGEATVPLVPAEPHSGEWMAWSNRGDESHTTLTRFFDLADLSEATLRFWSWYDLEEEFDYAYVSVSTDGGTLWRTLPTADSSSSDPEDNSIGHGFTGRSNDSRKGIGPPQWREQVVDLSAYTGHTVLLRFEMMTDQSVNEPGFLVDDISIPELGYREDFESGLGGWENEGFARVGHLLPQRYIVQLLTEGPEGAALVRLPMDRSNRLTYEVESFGTGVETVTVMISGATPYTVEAAPYQYEFWLEE